MRRQIQTLMLVTAAAAMLGARGVSAHENFRVIGTATKVQPTQIDVKTKDGSTIYIAVDKQTVVTRDKKKVGIMALKSGLSVVVDAYGDDDSDLLALEIQIVPPIGKSAPK